MARHAEGLKGVQSACSFPDSDTAALGDRHHMVRLPQSEMPRLVCGKAQLRTDALALSRWEIEHAPTQGQCVERAAGADAFVPQEDLGAQVRRVAP